MIWLITPLEGKRGSIIAIITGDALPAAEFDVCEIVLYMDCGFAGRIEWNKRSPLRESAPMLLEVIYAPLQPLAHALQVQVYSSIFAGLVLHSTVWAPMLS